MGLLTPLAVRIGAIAWLPRLLPLIVAIDKALQRVTGARVSLLGIAGLPNLALTVPGRKSGIPRTVPLLCVPYGDGWLIAGSYFGAPHVPAWVGNLRASDVVEVTIRRRVIPVTSRELTDEERGTAWQTMLRTWPNYALYEQRTSRVIPVFLLSPR